MVDGPQKAMVAWEQKAQDSPHSEEVEKAAAKASEEGCDHIILLSFH